MRIELNRGKFVRMTRGAGSTVTAHAGSVWITEENGVRDIVLRAGQSFTFRRSGLALVEAFSDAELSLEHSDRASIACADSV
jgi:hypothetical protein